MGVRPRSLSLRIANTRNEFEMAVRARPGSAYVSLTDALKPSNGTTLMSAGAKGFLVEITQRRLHFLKRAAQPVNNRGMCALHLCSLEFYGRQTACRFQLIRSRSFPVQISSSKS